MELDLGFDVSLGCRSGRCKPNGLKNGCTVEIPLGLGTGQLKAGLTFALMVAHSSASAMGVTV